MLTKDRIALRVTLTAFRRIVHPERVVAAVPDVDAWLYRLVQFAIREAVAGRSLDEVLSAKAALDAELRDYVRARIADSGVEVTELGVKDVILPGEEKVGRIDLHAGDGQGFDALLNKLVRLKPTETA
jgi:regulator of protease activity HflC (stomatin/prohibitin superfamily)